MNILFVLFTDTFFVEFKTEASIWNDDLTKEYHDTYINTVNMIVEIVSGENLPCQNGYFIFLVLSVLVFFSFLAFVLCSTSWKSLISSLVFPGGPQHNDNHKQIIYYF